MAIVGLPAPLGTSASSAVPTGNRTIAHPREGVNRGHLNSRTFAFQRHFASLIGITMPEI